MKISMIAAMGSNRVIGKDNGIPWHLPDDFNYFKSTTKGHHIIMGRKNFESLPKNYRPLPDRTNFVITRNKNYAEPGIEVFHNLEDALAKTKQNNEEEAFIIGGGEIYKMGLDYCDRIYLTEIDGAFDGDVHFPEFDKSAYTEVSRKHHGTDERHKYAFDFVVYDKK
ncbi:MAG: dihydrofolate reductase [Cyclobacteriaceae bacterium]